MVDSFLYAHLAAVSLLGVYISSSPDNVRSSEKSWTTLYQVALFVPAMYLVFYLAHALCQRWRRSCTRPQSSVSTFEAAGDDAYLIVDNVVEVDPKVDGDPERDGGQGVEKSYGSVAKKSRHQELWFNDD